MNDMRVTFGSLVNETPCAGAFGAGPTKDSGEIYLRDKDNLKPLLHELEHAKTTYRGEGLWW